MTLRETQTKFSNKLKRIDSVGNIHIDPKKTSNINFAWYENTFKLTAIFHSENRIHMSTRNEPGHVIYLGKRNIAKLSASQLETYIMGLLNNSVQTYITKQN